MLGGDGWWDHIMVRFLPPQAVDLSWRLPVSLCHFVGVNYDSYIYGVKQARPRTCSQARGFPGVDGQQHSATTFLLYISLSLLSVGMATGRRFQTYRRHAFLRLLISDAPSSTFYSLYHLRCTRTHARHPTLCAHAHTPPHFTRLTRDVHFLRARATRATRTRRHFCVCALRVCLRFSHSYAGTFWAVSFSNTVLVFSFRTGMGSAAFPSFGLGLAFACFVHTGFGLGQGQRTIDLPSGTSHGTADMHAWHGRDSMPVWCGSSCKPLLSLSTPACSSLC